MSCYFFIDESGDHNLKSLDKTSDLFLLAGCLIQDAAKEKLDQLMGGLKLKYFGTKEVVLHYRDIGKRNGHFKILQDKSVSHSFLSDVQSILRNIDYKVALSVIDKRAQIQEYGKTADDPYVISFNFLIERLINESKDGLAAEIIVERRGKKEDEQLPETWIRIYRRGLYGIQATAVQGKIREFKMNYKHDNISGLQLADLVVSSLSRKFRHPDKKEDFFELVSQKIMDDNGDVAGYGIKVFPRNSTLGKTISPLF